VEADDDGVYVLKFRGAGQGPKALIAELVAGEIARASGLLVPEIVFIELDPELARTEPDPEIQDLIRASAGLNFGIDSSLDMDSIRNHLEAIPIICTGGAQAGPIGQLSQRERFHWLVAPRSTIIQTSRVHTGFCTHLAAVLDHLLDTMVRPSHAKVNEEKRFRL
jgi:hypothetical protein